MLGANGGHGLTTGRRIAAGAPPGRRPIRARNQTSPRQAFAKRPRVFLAGPDVFLEHALATAACKKRLRAAHAMEGVFPLDEAIVERRRSPAPITLIRECDLVIARRQIALCAEAPAGTSMKLPAPLRDQRPYDRASVRLPQPEHAISCRGRGHDLDDLVLVPHVVGLGVRVLGIFHRGTPPLPSEQLESDLRG
jgi:hypothetical protein